MGAGYEETCDPEEWNVSLDPEKHFIWEDILFKPLCVCVCVALFSTEVSLIFRLVCISGSHVCLAFLSHSQHVLIKSHVFCVPRCVRICRQPYFQAMFSLISLLPNCRPVTYFHTPPTDCLTVTSKGHSKDNSPPLAASLPNSDKQSKLSLKFIHFLRCYSTLCSLGRKICNFLPFLPSLILWK